MLEADKNFQQFYYNDAHKQYIQSIEGYMEVLKITTDDKNYQSYLKGQIEYAMDRASKCKGYIETQYSSKSKAGYYNKNENKAAYNYLKDVLRERDPEQQQKDKENIQNYLK
mmetsp:Transcript_32567/g.31804  ORF Transcript_32567/g.31804 Transcript_32567/m.31804 type:complete len:112 (+) Transcript_32567:94-429(+)